MRLCSAQESNNLQPRRFQDEIDLDLIALLLRLVSLSRYFLGS